MWANSVQASALLSAGRWRVELFAASNGERHPKSELQYVALGSLFRESRLTIDPQTNPSTPITYIGMENVESGTGNLIGIVARLGQEIKSRSKVVRPGNILYGRLRPNLNKVYLCDDEVESGVCSGEFFVIEPYTDQIRPRVLKEILSSKLVLSQVVKFIGGAALPRVSIEDLASIKVPIPSMEKQLDLEKFLIEADQRRKTLKQELSNLPNAMEVRLLNALGIKESPEGVLESEA